MNYFSPERAILPNGQLMYYDEIGPVGPMPNLQVEPLNEEENEVPAIRLNTQKLRISVLLLDKPNTGCWYEIEIYEISLSIFLEQWRRDPEHVLRHTFKWPGMSRVSESRVGDKLVMGLDDL